MRRDTVRLRASAFSRGLLDQGRQANPSFYIANCIKRLRACQYDLETARVATFPRIAFNLCRHLFDRKRGSFAKSISERGPERVKTFAKHARGRLPIGRALLLREDPVGLYSELRISATEAGDEVLELVRDGTLDGLSIGFSPIKDRWYSARDMVERLEAGCMRYPWSITRRSREPLSPASAENTSA
jgi:HK97 family phage prohead protease